MVDEKEVEVQMTPMKDDTGTIAKPMTRAEVNSEIMRQAEELFEENKDKFTPEQQKQVKTLLSRLQQGIAMLNMMLNAMISDTAATTVFSIQDRFHLADFLAYQSTFNDQMASKLDIIEAAVLEIRRKKNGAG
jgi:hypothetical protein